MQERQKDYKKVGKVNVDMIALGLFLPLNFKIEGK